MRAQSRPIFAATEGISMQSAQIHADSRESHLKRARPAAVSLIGLLILVAALSLISYLTVQLWQTRKVRLVIQQAVTLLK